MRPIAALTLWLFVIGTSLILGAGLYETLVVVPFWSAGAPASHGGGSGSPVCAEAGGPRDT